MPDYSVTGFSDDELEYYSRQIVLKEIGISGQQKLKDAHVCLVGVGGLGSTIAVQLATMGVGHLRIVDRDVVETSNLQRQHIYSMDMVGYPKVEAAAERLRRMNPFVEVDPVPMSITPRNAEVMVEGMDVVVDGLDRMTPRYILNRACVRLGVPFVYGAVITHIGNASTIIPGETACLECFQGGMDDEALPTCAVAGVHPSVISIIASIQVSEAIRILLDKSPNLANKLVFCDLEDLSLEKINLAKVDTCPVCGSKPTSEPKPIAHEPFKEICGRERRRVFVYAPDEDLDFDLRALNENLRTLGYEIEVEARLGTTFSRGSVKGSVLKSGVTILEGMDGAEEAAELRGDIIKI
ncbi:MAG: HesA/MoeB/ThiF family protein [Candidatus Bathyarchaeota archaeon]|nr:HesA/MoeB/ThiF family protein [Candidatus Bathyarchaeota archaeon]